MSRCPTPSTIPFVMPVVLPHFDTLSPRTTCDIPRIGTSPNVSAAIPYATDQFGKVPPNRQLLCPPTYSYSKSLLDDVGGIAFDLSGDSLRTRKLALGKLLRNKKTHRHSVGWFVPDSLVSDVDA